MCRFLHEAVVDLPLWVSTFSLQYPFLVSAAWLTLRFQRFSVRWVAGLRFRVLRWLGLVVALRLGSRLSLCFGDLCAGVLFFGILHSHTISSPPARVFRNSSVMELGCRTAMTYSINSVWRSRLLRWWHSIGVWCNVSTSFCCTTLGSECPHYCVASYNSLLWSYLEQAQQNHAETLQNFFALMLDKAFMALLCCEMKHLTGECLLSAPSDFWDVVLYCNFVKQMSESYVFLWVSSTYRP